MLQKSSTVHKKWRFPKPDKDRKISLRYLFYLYKVVRWAMRWIVRGGLFFLRFFQREVIYLLGIFGLHISFSLWVALFLLPITPLVFLLSYFLRQKKRKEKEKKRENI